MSDRIKKSDVVVPSMLSPDEKEIFVDSLYQLHTQIFDGVDKTIFISYVVDSPATLTRIRVYKNETGDWIGYCAVHRFDQSVFDRSCVVFRAEAGLLREYRGRSLTLWFGFNEAIKYRLRHPFCSLYYLGSFVHPSVLYMFSRYFSEYYPRADSPLPDTVKHFMLELANIFHIKPVEGQSFLARQVGWITKESDEDRRYWQQKEDPTVKFYIQTNPGYVDGNGLLTLVPLTFSNITMSLVRFIKNKMRRSLFPGK